MRTPGARHSSSGLARYAAADESLSGFAVGQRVGTIDGVEGTIIEVLDGPVPGNEAYVVELDNGVGGGEYRSADVWPVEGRVASRVAYQGQHQPPRDGPPLHDLLDGDFFPQDVYETLHHYGWGGHLRPSIEVIERARGNPNAQVTIYRSVPPLVEDLRIETGNWVAITQSYADGHGEGRGYEWYDETSEWQVGDYQSTGEWIREDADWITLAAEVPAHTVRNGGNDILEWGYWGPPVSARIVHGRQAPPEHRRGHPDRRASKFAARADLPLADPGAVHTAVDDYPELGDVLWTNPDHVEAIPAQVTQVTLSKKGSRRAEAITIQDTIDNPNSSWFHRRILGPAIQRGNEALPPSHQITDVRRPPTIDWCFAGETEFLTIDGYRTFKEVVGTTQKVMDGRGRWVEAEVRSFGVQPLVKITLKKRRGEKVVYATADHRWLIQGARQGGSKIERVERMTSELSVGDRLSFQLPRRSSHVPLSRLGVMHGVVFGDGACESGRNTPAFINLWGDKDAELLPIFEGCSHRAASTSALNQDAVGVQVYGLPRFFKDHPSLDETPTYLYGWLAGYFAADGRVGANGGNIELSSASRNDLEFVQAVCNRVGIATYTISTTSRFSCTGGGRIHDYRVAKYGECSWDTVPSDLHTLRLVAETIPDDFFLLSSHRERFEARRRRDESRPQALGDAMTWHVTSIEETDRVEEVYCVTVPTTSSFVLQDGILTGNCRFRRDGHCYLPIDLDEQGTREAGYAVWIPTDRGGCPRTSHQAQKQCPVSEAGPDSGERLYAPDATYSWAEGGQRRDRRYSSKTAERSVVNLTPDGRFALGADHTPGHWTLLDRHDIISGVEGGMVYGIGYIHLKGDVLDEIQVDAGYRRQGLATMMVREVERQIGRKVEFHTDPGEYTPDGMAFTKTIGRPSIEGDPGATWNPLYASKTAMADAYRGTSRKGVELWDNNQSGSPFDPTCKVLDWQKVRAPRVAAWADVVEKGTRIRRDGEVRVIANTGTTVTAEVKGDHNIYLTSITRVPGTKQVGMWYCACDWNLYAWARSPRWKHLEGRQCSHSLALMYEMQSQEMFGGEIVEQGDIPEWRYEEPYHDRREGQPDDEIDWADQADDIMMVPVESMDFTSSIPNENALLALGNIADCLTVASSTTEDPDAHQRISAALESTRMAADRLRSVTGNLPGMASPHQERQGAQAPVEATALDMPTMELPGRSRSIDFSAPRGGQDIQLVTITGPKQVRVLDIVSGGFGQKVLVELPNGKQKWVSRSRLIVDGTPNAPIRLFGVKHEAVHSGVMVALAPSLEVRERLSNLAAEHGYPSLDSAEIHLTLAYLGHTDGVDRDRLHAAVRAFAAQHDDLHGTLSGLGTFLNGDSHVLWAAVDIPGLAAVRTSLVDALTVAGLPVANDHDFTPHITLSYADEPFTELPDMTDLAGMELHFRTIVAAYGGEWTHLDLVGDSGEAVAVEKIGGKTAAEDGLDAVMEFCSEGDFTHAGVVIKSADSGRVLMTQRTPFHGDDEETYGKWEFPGGSIDEGEHPLQGALREFREETGLELPDGWHVEDCYRGANPQYVGIVIVVPNEAWTTDAELLDLETMGIGWFDEDQITDTDLARPEMAETDWETVREAKTASGGKLYHLADVVDFRLDPNFHPENNTTLGGDWHEPGIFVAPDVERWVNGYGYWRPWVVEFDVPSGVGKNFGGETFIPATEFDQIRIARVVPLDAWAREEYGEWGWTEEFYGTDFRTGEPIDPRDRSANRGYRYPGDARQEDRGWQAQYAQRVQDFARESGRGGVLASLDTEADTDAILLDEPEPALPRVEGDVYDGYDDEPPAAAPPEPAQELPPAMAQDIADPDDGVWDGEDDVLAEPEPAPELGEAMEDPEPAEELMSATGAFVPGDARLAHLAPGAGEGDNTDIAEAASEYLRKAALKEFSPAEQQALINEGAEGHVGASNIDRLDITGTFYEDVHEDEPLFW